jgi:uncharacterized protein YjiS (DUF1127 family)
MRLSPLRLFRRLANADLRGLNGLDMEQLNDIGISPDIARRVIARNGLPLPRSGVGLLRL